MTNEWIQLQSLPESLSLKTPRQLITAHNELAAVGGEEAARFAWLAVQIG